MCTSYIFCSPPPLGLELVKHSKTAVRRNNNNLALCLRAILRRSQAVLGVNAGGATEEEILQAVKRPTTEGRLPVYIVHSVNVLHL